MTRLSSLERDNLVRSLVAAREGAKISARRVAFRAGVSPAAIRHVENHHNTPSERILRAYASCCALDCDRLLLAWGHVPDDVTCKLRERPELLAMVRSA